MFNGDLKLSTRLNVSSGVYALQALNSANSKSADLLVVTENGLVQLFRAKANRPPLLTNPRADESPKSVQLQRLGARCEKDEVMSAWNC
ncbi:MAG: hypothetical protein IPK53_07480 [bacterium]|nr:hypothetical protein [bacterium]